MKYDPCEGCRHNVTGRGSEYCDAVVGNYCPALRGLIQETEEDKKFLEEIQKRG